MKNLWKTTMLMLAFNQLAYAQDGFNISYHSDQNLKHGQYSIEEVKGGNNVTDYSYAIAGTIIDDQGNERMHVFTTDIDGNIIWEKIIEGDRGRVLDVALDYKLNKIAITGFLGIEGQSENLYIAVLDGRDGSMIIDREYTKEEARTVGHTITFCDDGQSLIIGGARPLNNSALLSTGAALLIKVDVQTLQPIWLNTINRIGGCIVLYASINEMLVLNKNKLLITGSVYRDIGPNGQLGYVLTGVIDIATGTMNFGGTVRPLNTHGAQVLGTSAHYDAYTQNVYLLYNAGDLVTGNLVRPYIDSYRFTGTALTHLSSYKFDIFPALSIPGFSSTNPNMAGLGLMPNHEENSLNIIGLMEENKSNNDATVVFSQEVKITSAGLTLPFDGIIYPNTLIASGFPNSNYDLYSVFKGGTMSGVYTPKFTTLGAFRNSYVTIAPIDNSNYGIQFVSRELGSTVDCNENFTSFVGSFNWSSGGCFNYNSESIQHELKNSPVENTIFTPELICGEWTPGEYYRKKSSLEGSSLRLNSNTINEELVFRIDGKGLYHLSIIDISGRKVLEDSFFSEGSDISVNTSSMKPGVYFLKVRTSKNRVMVKKIIKEL